MRRQPVHGETPQARLIRPRRGSATFPPRGKARTFIPFDTPKNGTRSLSSGFHIPQAGCAVGGGVPVIGRHGEQILHTLPFQRDDSGGLNGLHKRKAVVFGLPDLVFIRAVVQKSLSGRTDAARWARRKQDARPGAAYGKLSLGHGREDVQKAGRPSRRAPAHRSCRRHRTPRRARASTPAARPPWTGRTPQSEGSPARHTNTYRSCPSPQPASTIWSWGSAAQRAASVAISGGVVPCRQERAAGADHGLPSPGSAACFFCIGSK